MNVDRFNHRFEATPKQTRFIGNLVAQKGTTLEAVLVKLWGMPLIAAFSDRPWMRITKREASQVITHLLGLPDKAAAIEAQEDRREAYKSALIEHDEPTQEQFMGEDREPDSIRIEQHVCPF